MASAMTRIIHLADIHFGRDHCFSAGDKDGVEYLTKGSLAESLIDDIKSIGSTPDLVIVSGDLTSSGGRQEYNEAELFLKELSQKLNLDTSRFLIVPGNHDVFWGADPATVSNGDYLAFASRFFQLPVPSLDLPTCGFGDIFLLGLDSTKLLHAELGGLGLVGKNQLRDAAARLKDSASDSRFKFLIMHHHLLPVSWVESGPIEKVKSMTLDAPLILAWAQEYGITGILHGHQHQNFISTFHFADRPGVPFIVSGGASIGGRDLPPQTRNGYQWIEVHGRHINFIHRELDGTGKFGPSKQVEFVCETSGVFASNIIPSARSVREPSIAEMRTLAIAACTQILENIGSCYGPMGGLKAVPDVGGSSYIRDGISLVQSLSSSDPVQNRIIGLVTDLVKQVYINVGDGTKTAALIWAMTTKIALTGIADGHKDTAVASGIQDACLEAANYITKIQIPLADQKHVARIATTAVQGNDSIGNLVASVMGKVGKEGIILCNYRVDPSKAESFEELIEPGKFEIGTLPEWFMQLIPSNKSEVELREPLFLLYNGVLFKTEQVLKALEIAVDYSRPLVVICLDAEQEAMSLISTNTLQNVLTAIPIFYPRSDLNAILEDVSALTGAVYIRKETGQRLENVSPSDLGRADLVKLNAQRMIIDSTVNKGHEGRIISMVNRLRSLVEMADSPYAREKLQERLARLAGAHGTIIITGSTKSDVRLLRSLMANSLNSSRAGVEEGYVPGSGTSLLRAAIHAQQKCKGEPDYNIGVGAFTKGLMLPFELIVNSRLPRKASSLVNQVKARDNLVFDCSSGELVDSESSGPIDAAKMLKRIILLCGSSAAKMVQTRSIDLSSSLHAMSALQSLSASDDLLEDS
jgi:chaperonin GroEL